MDTAQVFAICLEWSVPKSGAGVVLKRAYGASVGLSMYARAGPADAGGLSFGVNDPGDKPSLPRIFHVASRERVRDVDTAGTHAGDRLDRLDRCSVPVTHRNRGVKERFGLAIQLLNATDLCPGQPSQVVVRRGLPDAEQLVQEGWDKCSGPPNLGPRGGELGRDLEVEDGRDDGA